MNKFVLREPFFLLAFALYPAFCRPREGQYGKLMFFSVLSFVPFISKKIRHCYLQRRKMSEWLVGEGGLFSQMVQVKGRKSI